MKENENPPATETRPPQLIDRAFELLKERYGNQREGFDSSNMMAFACALVQFEAAAARAAALEGPPRWIDVKEKLPEVRFQEALVYTSLSAFEVCEWDGTWNGDLRGEVGNPEIVTHWMPLPEPPVQSLDKTESKTDDALHANHVKQTGEKLPAPEREPAPRPQDEDKIRPNHADQFYDRKSAAASSPAARPQDDKKENAMPGFMKQLEALINGTSLDNASGTPDFILASYLAGCLENLNRTVTAREDWYGRGKMAACAVDKTNAEPAARTEQPTPPYKFIRFERDKNNGANLHAVFFGDRALHHFKAGDNVEAYMADVQRNLDAYVELNQSPAAPVAVVPGQDFTPWTYQMLRESGESMRDDADVVLTDETDTDYLIDGFKLRNGVVKLLIVKKFHPDALRQSTHPNEDTIKKAAVVEPRRTLEEKLQNCAMLLRKIAINKKTNPEVSQEIKDFLLRMELNGWILREADSQRKEGAGQK